MKVRSGTSLSDSVSHVYIVHNNAKVSEVILTRTSASLESGNFPHSQCHIRIHTKQKKCLKKKQTQNKIIKEQQRKHKSLETG